MRQKSARQTVRAQHRNRYIFIRSPPVTNEPNLHRCSTCPASRKQTRVHWTDAWFQTGCNRPQFRYVSRDNYFLSLLNFIYSSKMNKIDSFFQHLSPFKMELHSRCVSIRRTIHVFLFLLISLYVYFTIVTTQAEHRKVFITSKYVLFT